MIKQYEEYKNIIYSIAILLIFVILTLIVKKYFLSIAIIILILFISKPFYNLLCRIKIFNPKINGIISIVVVNILIFFVIFYIGNFIYSIINHFANSYTNLILGMQEFLKNIRGIDVKSIEDINLRIREHCLKIVNSNVLTKGAIYTTDGIFSYLVGNIVAYFILTDRYVIVRFIEKFISKNKLKFLKNKFDEINKIIKIELALVLVTTVETILGLMALNIKEFLPLGILCGILDILPYIGTIIIFAPLILYKFIQKQYIIGFGLICLYIFLIINRQIMEAKFMSKNLEVHPLFVITSSYVGIKLFGIIGLFMGPLYVLTIKQLFETEASF